MSTSHRPKVPAEGTLGPASHVRDGRPVVEDLQHRSIPLLHQPQLHVHDGLLRICGRATSTAKKKATPRMRIATVSQEPGPLSTTYRGRVPKVSANYRGHAVHHEPGPHRSARRGPATPVDVAGDATCGTTNAQVCDLGLQMGAGVGFEPTTFAL